MDYESIRVHANMETMKAPDAVFIRLRPHQASIAGGVQLSVSVIVAFGGAEMFSEQVTLRLLLASAATPSGVTIVLTQCAAKVH